MASGGHPATPILPPDHTIRPQVGLMLSCGEPPTTARGYPKKLDYMRPKPGALGQYQEAAQKFTEVFGDRPRSIDVLFVSDLIPEVLNVRPMVFGTAGLKAVGRHNLAMYPPGEFADQIRAFDWDLTTFPDNQPDPGEYKVNGRDDKVVTKMGLKVYATLYVSIPKVTGLMMVAAVSTTSARTAENWHNALNLAQRITGGVLVGIPFKLMLRPARVRYFDAKEKKRKTSEFQEWTLESQHSLEELYVIAGQRREAVNAGAPRLALPAGPLDGRPLEVEGSQEQAAADLPFVPVETFDELQVAADDEQPIEDAELVAETDADSFFEQRLPADVKAAQK